ncbi:hypothetical protein SCHPADRAFT_900246 [Schizopora paradoxa]|uniref:Uncharacterized protein n=1 Tax=Schizopora paradoxa TaxID=27342 RepID=A0A0H2S0J5_9AGAM|nr:hypothetical protein SCHPADRAFT_900246 [Schizopora paradoxa]
MSISEQHPFNPNDITFNQPGGPVRFDNPSDTIFASIFLPVSSYANEDGVPWQFCDRILSAIRRPQFNPKDITFKDCGDMFRCVGRRRHDMWSSIEARPTSDSSFPLVILDGVLEWIKAQRLSISARSRVEERHFQNVLRRESDGWKQCLQNMMLVHSSWHASVKRFLGYKLVSSRGPAPNRLQNPVFGRWTKEAYLSFHYDDVDSDYDSEDEDYEPNPPIMYPVAPSKRHGYFLSTLCSLIPNTRLVHLSLPEISVAALATVCNALSTLPLLEELIFEAGNQTRELPLQRTFDAVANTHLPTLHVLRLYTQTLDCDNPSDVMPSLDSLEKLHSVQILYPAAISTRSNYLDSRVSSALWAREPSERRFLLAPIELQVDCCFFEYKRCHDGMQYMGENDAALRDAKLVRLHFRFPDGPDGCNFGNSPESLVLDLTVAPDRLAHTIAPWLELCTAARTLVFHKFPWTKTEIFKHLHVWSIDFEEFVIEFDSLPWPPDSKSWDVATDEEKDRAKQMFSLDDIGLSQVVGTGLFPSLQILKVVVPGQVLKLNGSGLFPHCKQKCAESSIRIEVKSI